MGSKEEIKIDIIGAGQVVQRFLSQKNPGIEMRVYARRSQENSEPFVQPIHTFEPSDRILVLCASTDEERVLKNNNSQGRIAVAKENLAITNNLIRKGIFRNQFVFVITNPSEIVAEHIYRHSGNQHVYALGLQTDQKRYSEILEQREFSHLRSHFHVSGNHHDFPYPVFDPPLSRLDEDTIINSLNAELQTKIRNEFNDYRPPIESGVTALKNLIQSLIAKQTLTLSGYCGGFDCFSGGLINFNSFTFSPSLGNSDSSKARIQTIANRHRDTYFAITSNQSLKESV